MMFAFRYVEDNHIVSVVQACKQLYNNPHAFSWILCSESGTKQQNSCPNNHILLIILFNALAEDRSSQCFLYISIIIVKPVIHRVNISESSPKQSEVKPSGLGQGVFDHDYTIGSVGA